MNDAHFQKTARRIKKMLVRVLAFLGLTAWLLGTNAGFGAEPTLTKHQVEAVFLLNFAKYADWPEAAFTNASAPIVIGVLGTDPFGDDLRRRVEGKTINGRSLIIKYLTAGAEISGCHILFVSDSEAARAEEILGRAGTLPILTVGEGEPFAQNGGIISFVLKNGKVRLEIDLVAARKAQVTLSSKLLAVADVVKGKTN